MSVHEVIIYRNPLEAIFWETVSSGAALPIFIWIFLFLALLLFLDKNFGKSFNKHPGVFVIGSLIVAAVSTWALMKVI